MDILDAIASSAFLAAVLRVTTPYLFAALGGLLAEHVGVPNIALEGQMLTAACVGVLVAGTSGSVWLGVLGGVLAGAVVAALLAAATLELEADPIIAGIGLNILASGATAFTVFSLLGDKGGTTAMTSGTVPTLTLPGLSQIPVLGPVLSGQSVLTWAAVLLVPGVAWVLYRTRFGYHLRAVGEKPEAAASVGIRSRRVQYATLALSGALAGLGGVFLSMAAVSFFVRDMTAGRGFIALAAVFLGGLRPLGVALAALGFGVAEALAIQLGNFDIPPEVVTAIPYLLTLVALGYFAARRRRAPRRQAGVRTAATSGGPP